MSSVVPGFTRLLPQALSAALVFPLASYDAAQAVLNDNFERDHEKTQLCRAMVEAVQWLHCHSEYVHMDIKPHQFFLLAEGKYGINWKLGDFDCARKRDDPASSVSSPLYAPPERVESGDGDISAEHSYDVWYTRFFCTHTHTFVSICELS